LNPDVPVSVGQSIGLNVMAADNTAITRIAMFDNDALFAESSALAPASVYSNQFTWKANGLGKHTLRAVAYDGNGLASAPAEINLTVINDNRAPQVLITAPLGVKDAIVGAPLTIQGVATDDVAVTRIDLIVDNQLLTFVTSDKPEGVTPFAVAFSWTPTVTGLHNVVLRAYDNLAQSDDSLRSTVRVFDNQPPIVTAQTERSPILLGDALLVQALALSNNGIEHMELYVDELRVDMAISHSPAQQTTLRAPLVATDLATGTHSYFVRAYDITGLAADTERHSFNVVENSSAFLQDTPQPINTPTAVPPTNAPTPTLVPPGPPTVELAVNGDANALILPNAVPILITARGSAELDRIELWAQYPGETSAQLLMEENGKGATDKIIPFAWNTARPGVVDLYARIIDNFGQSGISQPLRLRIQAPLAPTQTPAIFDFAQTWIAESPAARYDVTFSQLGRALRGVFVEKRADGNILNGNVITGAVSDQNALFAVDFAGDTIEPKHTLEFICAFTVRPPQLTCNYTNEKGERGSAIFAPLEQ
ncbi:MAG TPA: hypothetical protein VFD70_03190, partial [Anaerolineae bacterium]|nr:hypothetical protein [Anaerolineae bacterium]